MSCIPYYFFVILSMSNVTVSVPILRNHIWSHSLYSDSRYLIIVHYFVGTIVPDLMLVLGPTTPKKIAVGAEREKKL